MPKQRKTSFSAALRKRGQQYSPSALPIRHMPKQFLPIGGGCSMPRQAVKRTAPERLPRRTTAKIPPVGSAPAAAYPFNRFFRLPLAPIAPQCYNEGLWDQMPLCSSPTPAVLSSKYACALPRHGSRVRMYKKTAGCFPGCRRALVSPASDFPAGRSGNTRRAGRQGELV